MGESGSGKTNLICNLLQPVERFTVVDSKMHQDEFAAWARSRGIPVTSDPAQIAVQPRVIFQISEVALRDRGGWYVPGRPGHSWTLALRAMKAKGAGVVIFDEVLQTLPAGGSHPEAWTLFTQGSAFKISAWGGTQVPNRMETLLPRLAEHCFAARMINRQDQRILTSSRGLDCAQLAQLPDYHFAYHRKPAGEWTQIGQLPLLLPARF